MREAARMVGPTTSRRAVTAGARVLLAAACGLLLAGTALASAPPSRGGDEDAHPLTGPAAGVAPGGDEPAAIATLAEREECADGLDAAASYQPSPMAGPTVGAIRDRGHLIVGVDQNSYLWGYREPDSGDLVGFDLDLVEYIAIALFGSAWEDKVHYLAIPTDERIPALQEGRVDMVVRSMSITCERWGEVAFSTAYFETGQQLLVPEDSAVTGYDDSLAGAVVCSAEGSTAQEVLRDEAHGAELIFRPNHLDCLVLIQLGLADALMTDSALAAGHAAQDPGAELVDEPITAESYGVAMNQRNVDLVRWVNSVLSDYIAGGGWRAAYDQWLEPYLGDRSATPPEPRYRD